MTTTFQIFIYGPMQAHLYGHFSDHDIMISNIISLLVLLFVFPIVGKLSDKINREKIVGTACIGFLILGQSFFYLLSQGELYQLIIVQALIAIPAGAYYATVPVMLAEMFPLRLRCTVLSVLYSVAASLAAGTAPLLSLILVKKTGVASSPALLIFTLVTCLFITKSLQLLTNKKHKTQPSLQ